MEPPHFFSFRWVVHRDPGAPVRDGNSTLVEFSLSPEGDATRLTVVESGFRDLSGPEDENQGHVDSHRRGWDHELGELQEYAEKGCGRPMTPAIAEVDELWAAVGDPTRRRVLDVLLDRGEATATVVAGELPVTRQAVAKHLAVLDRAGLVEGRRHGREMRFAVRPERLDAAARSMAEVAAAWDTRLHAIKRIAEAAAAAQRQQARTRKETR